MYRLAPAVAAALDQATARWPGRARLHDGTVGDAAHRTRRSDHNPDDRGVVLAFDLTHDPTGGCDAHALVRAAVARRDPRIKYAISRGRIWSREQAGKGWRPYPGPNPHDAHAHVSVRRAHEHDTGPWWNAPDDPDDEDEDEDMPKLVTVDGKTVYSVTAHAVEHVRSPAALALLRRHKLLPRTAPETITADELEALRTATAGR